MSLTLADIRELAVRNCPRKARWGRLVRRDAPAWGPSHEIAHALLSLPDERARPGYGLCDVGFCRCPHARCDVVEVAAIKISARLLIAAGRPDAVRAEVEGTEGYDEIMEPWFTKRAHRLLGRRGLRLGALPRTRAGLERLLERRLGRDSLSGCLQRGDARMDIVG